MSPQHSVITQEWKKDQHRSIYYHCIITLPIVKFSYHIQTSVILTFHCYGSSLLNGSLHWHTAPHTASFTYDWTVQKMWSRSKWLQQVFFQVRLHLWVKSYGKVNKNNPFLNLSIVMCDTPHGPIAIYTTCMLHLHIQHFITNRIHRQYQNMQDCWYLKQAVMNSW